MTACTCLSVEDTVRLHFAAQQPPRCPEHDPPVSGDPLDGPDVTDVTDGTEGSAGTPLALNDDDGLRAVLARALGPITTPDPRQPFDAA